MLNSFTFFICQLVAYDKYYTSWHIKKSVFRGDDFLHCCIDDVFGLFVPKFILFPSLLFNVPFL